MPDRIAEHYDRNAHAFDMARRRNFVEQHWLDRFLLAVPRGGHILDLGCGGGEPVARYMIDSGRSLTGVDVSQNMIGLSRTRFGRHTFIHSDMRTVAIDQRFDGVLAWDSLFHLPHQDQADMLQKIGRWMNHGAPLLFNSGPARGEVIGTQFGDPLYHASLDPHEYRELFRLFGLSEMAYVPEDQSTGGRTVWLARKTG